VPLLPADKPRYLMGVGKPRTSSARCARGIDMFDCVLPTRSGRTGQAFTRRGAVNIRNAAPSRDPRPLDEACACPACCNYSRAYLHHLWRAEEILGQMLLTWHNLHYYQQLMASLRAAIAEARLDAWIAIFASEQPPATLRRSSERIPLFRAPADVSRDASSHGMSSGPGAEPGRFAP
jgi:queuine tRNA-ribosyltransferase